MLAGKMSRTEFNFILSHGPTRNKCYRAFLRRGILIYNLKATNARVARIEASAIEPTKSKTLRGFDKNGECTYISCVRERGNKHPVATAVKGDDKKTYSRFEAEVK